MVILTQRRPKTKTFKLTCVTRLKNSAWVFWSNNEIYPQSSYTSTSVTKRQPLLPEIKRAQSRPISFVK